MPPKATTEQKAYVVPRQCTFGMVLQNWETFSAICTSGDRFPGDSGRTGYTCSEQNATCNCEQGFRCSDDEFRNSQDAHQITVCSVSSQG